MFHFVGVVSTLLCIYRTQLLTTSVGNIKLFVNKIHTRRALLHDPGWFKVKMCKKSVTTLQIASECKVKQLQ